MKSREGEIQMTVLKPALALKSCGPTWAQEKDTQTEMFQHSDLSESYESIIIQIIFLQFVLDNKFLSFNTVMKPEWKKCF